MTQELLDRSQISACIKQMRGKGVPQSMRTGFECDPTCSCVVTNEASNTTGCESSTAGVQKDRDWCRRCCGGKSIASFWCNQFRDTRPIQFEGIECFTTNRYDAFFVAF